MWIERIRDEDGPAYRVEFGVFYAPGRIFRVKVECGVYKGSWLHRWFERKAVR